MQVSITGSLLVSRVMLARVRGCPVHILQCPFVVDPAVMSDDVSSSYGVSSQVDINRVKLSTLFLQRVSLQLGSSSSACYRRPWDCSRSTVLTGMIPIEMHSFYGIQCHTDRNDPTWGCYRPAKLMRLLMLSWIRIREQFEHHEYIESTGARSVECTSQEWMQVDCANNVAPAWIGGNIMSNGRR